MYWKAVRRLNKYMVFGKEYLVPELYKVIYPNGRGWVYDWIDFDNTIIAEMKRKGYIRVIPDTSSTPIKIYKKKRFSK